VEPQVFFDSEGKINKYSSEMEVAFLVFLFDAFDLGA
jgi:hypothetical protein